MHPNLTPSENRDVDCELRCCTLGDVAACPGYFVTARGIWLLLVVTADYSL